MGTFEQAWAAIDQKVDQGTQYAQETVNSLQQWASDAADRTEKSFLDSARSLSASLSNFWSSIKEKFQWAVNSGKQVVEWAKTAVASISNSVNSFQDSINNGLAVIKKEWGQYYAEVKDDAGNTTKMAMERTTATGKEVLANVDGKWQYVKDAAGDYADKAQAIATVAYNNTLKKWVDATKTHVQAWINVARNTVKDLWRQYNDQLAQQRWETSFASKWEPSPAKTENKDVNASKDYIVKSGDTLSKVALSEVGWDKTKAAEYLKKVIDANKGIDPNKIAIGQKIHLPKIA